MVTMLLAPHCGSEVRHGSVHTAEKGISGVVLSPPLHILAVFPRSVELVYRFMSTIMELNITNL